MDVWGVQAFLVPGLVQLEASVVMGDQFETIRLIRNSLLPWHAVIFFLVV